MQELPANSLKQKRHKIFTNPVSVILATTLLYLSSQIVAGLVLVPLLFIIKPDDILQLFLLNFISLIMLFIFLVIIKKILRFSWQAIGWRMPSYKWLSAVIPAALIYFLISVGIMLLSSVLIPGFDINQAQEIGFKHVDSLLKLVLVGISLIIITPLIEETIFRGVLFSGMRQRLPFWLSAAITSLLFALAHMQWNVALDTFALSLVMCFLVEKSKSISPTILLHALKNSVAFALLFIIK